MATKKTTYKSKAKINSIRATSRISLKVGETFYTLEYCEERIIPDDADIEKERKLLWDTVNIEVDKQAEDVQNMYKK
jgi:hypothetical protein